MEAAGLELEDAAASPFVRPSALAAAPLLILAKDFLLVVWPDAATAGVETPAAAVDLESVPRPAEATTPWLLLPPILTASVLFPLVLADPSSLGAATTAGRL